MDEHEEWRAVIGYEGRYEVSSLGNVRSLLHNNGRPWHSGPRPVAVYLKRQYVRFCLYKNCRKRERALHHVVLEAFDGPRSTMKEISGWNHLNCPLHKDRKP